MKFTTTAEYNNHLVETLTRIALKDYIIRNHEMFHSEQDLTFMDEFMKLCEQSDKFVVPQEMLQKYGVLNNIETSGNIKRLLEQNNLEKDRDYLLHNVVEQDLKHGGYSTKKDSKILLINVDQQDLKHGGSNKKVYTLTPEAFKLCLIRSKNSKTYAKYYLFIEKIVHYYSKYECSYKDKISNNMSAENEMLRNDMKQLMELTKNTNDKLTITNTKLSEVQIELSEIKAQLKRLISIVISLAYAPTHYQRFYDEDNAGKDVPAGRRFSLTSLGKTKTIVYVAVYHQEDDQLIIYTTNRKLGDPLSQINKIIKKEDVYNDKFIINYCEEHDLDAVDCKEYRDKIGSVFNMVLMPQAHGIASINEQELRSRLSSNLLSSKLFKQAMREHKINKDIDWNYSHKSLTLSGVKSLKSAQDCFNAFVNANREISVHLYDKALEKSIEESNEIVATEVVDELKRRNNEFFDRSKHMIDTFYKKNVH